MNERLFTFSSFYRAAYAKDKLADAAIPGTLIRIPPNLVMSCGYGLKIGEKDVVQAQEKLLEAGIPWKQILIKTEKGYFRK